MKFIKSGDLVYMMEFLVNDPVLSSLVEELVKSIHVELNPQSLPTARLEAHKFCEKFRAEESPGKICMVGIILTYNADIQIVFAGLRIIEDVTKYHWAELENRELVKERLLFLLQNGFASIPNQPNFLNEALARNVVEIAKREWPQLWPDLVPSLLQSQSLSAFLVLRRLFEDIAFCQNDDPFPRKRELLQSLVAVSKTLIPSTFQLLLRALEAHSNSPSQITLSSCKVLLGLLLPFLELTTFDVFEEDNRLSLIFQILRHPDFRIEASECLVQIINRKSDKKEKPRILSEFMSDTNYAALAEIARTVETSEVHLLKQICDIWSFMGTACPKDPNQLRKFLSLAESLASRGEVFTVLGAANALNNLLRSVPDIKDTLPEDELLASLNNILNCIVKRLVSPSVREEKDELGRLKSELNTLIKTMSKMWLKLYAFVSPWIVDALNHSDKMEVFQWEALSAVIDSVTATVSHDEDDVLQLGLHHLELCFQKFTKEQNVPLKSAILSSVSGLFIFFSLAKRKNALTPGMTALMMSIMKAIFNCFSYSESDRVIRRHAAALIIKLASTNGDLFLDIFDYIHKETMHWKEKLSSMEYASLVEALLIISNSWDDRAQQLKFISSLLNPVEWQDMAALTQSVTEFAALFNEDVFLKKRPVFLRNLQVIVAIFSRTSFPTSEALLSASDFAEALFDILRPILPVVLGTVKVIHRLILDPSTTVLLEMPLSEKHIALGINDATVGEDSSKAEKTFKDKLQVFLRAVEDASYVILGGCGPKFASKLYTIPEIADAYLSYIGSTSLHMHNFQIRRILKMVYRPFLLSCPSTHMSTVMIPFLHQFGPFMMTRLVASWEKVNFDELDDADAPSEEAEIIENSTLRILTKDYFDILIKLLEMSPSNEVDLNKTFYVGTGMETEEETAANGHATRSQRPYASTNDLGEIGRLLLSDVICFQSIVHLSATALCWKFSQVNAKASKCLIMSMKYIGNFPEVVHAVLSMALRSVMMFSDHEINFDGTFRIIDHIFCDFHTDPAVLQILCDWGVKEEDILRLRNLSEHQAAANLKKRKEVFRNILRHHPVIVRNRGPQSQWLSNLPKLLVYNQDKQARKQTAAKEIDLKECFSLIHIS